MTAVNMYHWQLEPGVRADVVGAAAPWRSPALTTQASSTSQSQKRPMRSVHGVDRVTEGQ
jgi:hypothetical protein